MRLVQTVRIGGRLALALGVISVNLMSGNSLSYYYGYTSASFGIQQGTDPFANQNVSFAPQVSMVSTANQSQSYDYGLGSVAAASNTATTAYSNGFNVLASTYGYSAPATVQTTTTYTAQSTSGSTWGTVSNSAAPSTVTFSAWNPSAGASGMLNTSYSAPATSGGGFGSFGGYNSFGSYNTTSAAPSLYAIVYSDYSPTSFNAGGWQAVNMSVIPRVANQITTPTSPTVGGPKPTTPTVNLGSGPGITVGAPEPGTWFSMSAGLAFLLFKLRRRS